MSVWQERFTHKLERVQEAARDRFERVANEMVMPLFEQFKEFTAGHDFHVTSPLEKPGLRTFKFAVTENAYVFMTFRRWGLEGCEMQSEFFVPCHCGLEPLVSRVTLGDADETWGRGVFEASLDCFMDAFVESLTPDDDDSPAASGKSRSRRARPVEKAALRG